MSSALAVLHLNMVYRFPKAFSWVPSRRRGQVAHDHEGSLDTLVLAKSAPAFYAWLGQNVAPDQRSRYAYLESEETLSGFRGRVLILPGGWSRKDVAVLVEAIEPGVQCGRLSWAA